MLTALAHRDLVAELTAEADRRGMSRSEAIRRAVVDWIARPPDVTEAA